MLSITAHYDFKEALNIPSDTLEEQKVVMEGWGHGGGEGTDRTCVVMAGCKGFSLGHTYRKILSHTQSLEPFWYLTSNSTKHFEVRPTSAFGPIVGMRSGNNWKLV